MVLALKFMLSPMLECCSNLIVSSEIQEVVSVVREFIIWWLGPSGKSHARILVLWLAERNTT